MKNILKKQFYVILSILFFFIIITIILFNRCIDDDNDDNLVQKSLKVTTSQTVPEYQYILKEYNGKLAVFEFGKSDPQMIFDVTVDSLPEIDVIELKKGLKVRDSKELNERIEDFIS